MNKLIGREIWRILISPDAYILTFDCGGSDVSYETYGDCCSETWFADITGVSALLGGVVKSFEMMELPEIEDGRTRQDYDRFYGIKIVTDKGYADIVYRNSSNGYYGGGIMTRNEPDPTGMIEITDDWSA